MVSSKTKSVKAGNRNIVKIISGGVVLWGIAPISLTPRVRYGGDRQVSVYLRIPTSEKGFTRIEVNYDWIYDNDGSEINFMLSDSRSFGWSCGSRHYPRKEGTDEGVSGSPASKIEIRSINEPIDSIRIDIIFKKYVTSTENIKVTAEYIKER